MHEKTLLYAALGFTAIAAGFGVYKAQHAPPPGPEITPVSVTDAKTHAVSRAEVPIRLTSSDGTGLSLRSLKAKAAIEDPLALTELHLVFENPENRILEGTFRIALPQGASLSRFAMKVDGIWQEGEVVEKQAARRAYEDFLHKRQDPALMEQGAGNEFTARVFPIPPRGTKEIVVAYSEVLQSGAPYVLPLQGLPMLGSLDIDVHAAGKARAEQGGRSDATFGLHQQRFTPAEDFVVEGRRLPRSAGLRSGDVAIARVVPYATSRPDPVKSVVILVDTSASRALGLREQTALVRALVAKLPPSATVAVACFDQEVATIYEGAASGFGDSQASAITTRGALGASNFEQAIGWAGEHAKAVGAHRVVFVGDGVATAGETDPQRLKGRVEALRAFGVERMDAIAVGGIRDDAFLRTVVRGVLDKDGVVLDGALGADALARRLAEATSSGVPVKVAGASWSYPEKLDGLQAGDEVMVFATVAPGAPVRVTVGTQDFEPDLRTIDRPLVERAWAQAKIQSLVDDPMADAATTRRDIIALSTRHRVLSPHTAMLVLETDWDYQRFGIDRSATVDILTVENGHVGIMQSPRSWEEKRRAIARDDVEGADKKEEEAKGGQMPEPPLGVAASAAAVPTSAPTTVAPAQEAPAAATPPTAEPPANAAPAVAPTSLAKTEPAKPSKEKAVSAPATRGDVSSLGVGGGGKAGASGVEPQLSPAPAESEARRRQTRIDSSDPWGSGAPTATAPAPARALARPAPTANAPAQPCSPNDPLCAQGQALGRGPTPERPRPPARNEHRATATEPQVRAGALVVESGISADEAQRVLRAAIPRMRACYENALVTRRALRGRMDLVIGLDASGSVKTVEPRGGPNSEPLRACIVDTVRAQRFPAPGSGQARFTASFDFVDLGTPGESEEIARTPPPNVPTALPYEGRFRIVMEKLSHGEKESALAEANQWHAESPGDVMGLVALGEALEAKGDVRTAARAYGSILELFSFRADSRRFAGERLERLHDAEALKLAADTYGKAAEQRPDHPASHRLHAFTLLKLGEHEKAFEAMRRGAMQQYPAGRFAGADRIMKEDLGLIAAVWSRAEPTRASEIQRRLAQAGGVPERGPSLRFVLVWETDANDVDFHIHDARGGHAYYANRSLPDGGGELYADVTTGYGPECFTIRGDAASRPYPYTLQAHYYARGPMGYGMGKLEIIDHDGKGKLSFDERPFVVMIDRAYVDLGTVEKSPPQKAASLK